MSDHHRSSRILPWLVVAATVGPATPAAASWSVSARWIAPAGHGASDPAASGNRVWQFRPPGGDGVAELRSVRLSDGRGRLARSFRVLPTTPGARPAFPSTGVAPQLLVADATAFVSGRWCADRHDEGDGDAACGRQDAYMAQVSLHTGMVERLLRKRAPRHLVGGDRVTWVRPVEDGAAPTGRRALRDARTDRVVLRLPASARDVQGAGRFVAWKELAPGHDAGDRDAAGAWRTLRVVDRLTGRTRWTLARRTLARRIGAAGVRPDLLRLAPDGSVGVGAAVRGERAFHPVVVDSRGRVRRVTRRPLVGASSFATEMRDGRVLLVVGEEDGTTSCGGPAGWLTEPGGRRGARLDGRLPGRAGYAATTGPRYLSDARTAWWEARDATGRLDRTRLRVGREVPRLTLRSAERPRCAPAVDDGATDGPTSSR
ncbi:MAG: hypothetical protein M0P31_09230 [Solirubrobacteraceae bacterium]|nr:hypothetical protein [Solirubrobacteraceae bacterium]